MSVAALEALGGWFFDGQQNSLAGLKPQSLAFSTILTVGYLDAVHLSPRFANVARIYKPLRNDFHFPLALALPDLIDNPDLDLEAELIVIANQDVVDTANALGRELPTAMPDLERLPA